MGGRVRLKSDGMLDEDMPTLLELSFKYVSTHLDILHLPSCSRVMELREDIVIPSEICDRIFQHHQEFNEDVNDSFVQIFRDTHRSPLRRIALRNCTITDAGLELILQHNLVALSLWYCDSITTQSWHTLLRHSQNLRILELGRYVDILKRKTNREKEPLDIQMDMPNLQVLRMNAVVLTPTVNFSTLQQLTLLDLTACVLENFSIEAIVGMPNLTQLILFNVWPLQQELPAICKLKKLTTLDISTAFATNSNGVYTNPNENLSMLIEELPMLTHLDISGTNLAGTGVATVCAVDKVRSSDIPGLVSRTNNPLQFLGLYNTAHSACRRFDIPAIQISGEANETQILTSARVYQDRPIMLTKVLNDLYHWLRFECCSSIHTSLDVVLTAMDRHLRVKHMQISGSATLFYIVKGRDKSKFGTPLKNHIIRTLLNGMGTHLQDDTMMRNGCLTLCQFSIPNDVLFEYERLVKILLHGVADSEQEGFVQRIAIYLLNSLACQVDGRQKLFLGDLGAISTMLNLINDRFVRKVFDDVMEVAWSTMWNVTDETPLNCERFLDGSGMEYFLGCLLCFPDKEELVRNMMGLLGNVAEVQPLRHRLMKSEFIRVFAKLLESSSDGIEVSYNAAGVLAHIASDGKEAWVIETPARDEVLHQMVLAIDRWDIHAERNINYRSFEPIIGLLRCHDTPECQYWACWALANLTNVYPLKYALLVMEEQGLLVLRELLNHPKPNMHIKELAQIVLDNCDGVLRPPPPDCIILE